MLKIWGRSNSLNVQKVMWCVGELGLEHVRIDAGRGYGLNNEAWFREMNPNGLVPCIDDEGFVLWESNAIVRYLAARYDLGGLYPEDLQARADADRWMDWQPTTLLKPINVVFWGLIRTDQAQRDQAALAQAERDALPLLGILDRHLAERPYMTGERFTMGDIPVGALTNRWYHLPIERPPLPHLEDWYRRLQERPAFRQQVMIPLS